MRSTMPSPLRSMITCTPAGAVLAVMRDAGVDRATLVGHSMGGPVIYRVYEQAPEKVAGAGKIANATAQAAPGARRAVRA